MKPNEELLKRMRDCEQQLKQLRKDMEFVFGELELIDQELRDYDP